MVVRLFFLLHAFGASTALVRGFGVISRLPSFGARPESSHHGALKFQVANSADVVTPSLMTVLDEAVLVAKENPEEMCNLKLGLEGGGDYVVLKTTTTDDDEEERFEEIGAALDFFHATFQAKTGMEWKYRFSGLQDDSDDENRKQFRFVPGVTGPIYSGLVRNPSIRTNLRESHYTRAPMGIISSESAFSNGTLALDPLGNPYDVTAIAVESSGGNVFQKFYLMQLIELEEDGKFGVMTRWGAAGTPGFAQELEYDTLAEARARFDLKFKEKVGMSWAESNDHPLNHKDGKYQRTFSLKQDQDAKDVLLTKETTNGIECVALSFSQPKLGEYVVETSLYLDNGVKSSCSRHMEKDLQVADERFRFFFQELAGLEWHERNSAPLDKFYSYRRGVQAAIFAGYAANPSIRTDLCDVLVPTDGPLETVDPESKFVSSATIEVLDGKNASAMLLMDYDDDDQDEGASKFYSIQLVATSDGSFGVVSRWGATGSPGFMQEIEFAQLSDAEKRFKKKFREKTGQVWGQETSRQLQGKYSIVGDGVEADEEPEEQSIPLGVVDHVAPMQQGKILLHNGEPLDAMMALIDPAKKLDKFFVLQVIEEEDRFTVFTRHGDIGTTGISSSEPFEAAHDAKDRFFQILEDKIGYTWDDRFSPTKGKKYRFIEQDFAAKKLRYSSGQWQYWVDDGVDGKSDGWYNYTKEGGRHVEQLFTEKNFNANLANRIVQSGEYKYEVDLARMIQTNAVHHDHTSRRIRRLASKNPQTVAPISPSPDGSPAAGTSSSQSSGVPASSAADDDSEVQSEDDVSTPASDETGPVAAVSAAVSTDEEEADEADELPEADVAVATDDDAGTEEEEEAPSQTTQTKQDENDIDLQMEKENNGISTGQEEGLQSVAPDCGDQEDEVEPTNRVNEVHIVDPDISVRLTQASAVKVVYDETADQWYDAVLNQCNVASNNNKYYKLQMVENEAQGKFWLWLKWGRVGDATRLSNSDLLGPFTKLGHAKSAFRSKFKAKTGNDFRSREFTERAGKYKPVEIDNSAIIVDDDGEGRNVVQKPCTLDDTTRALIELLFSKDTRDKVLQRFGIDLKRLPLGLPSRLQINSGIDVLNVIDSKLKAGDNAPEEYQDLSSAFYTRIPHTFSRGVRPPTIDTAQEVQKKYDMCNVLLDMHSTSEAMRGIEEDRPMLQVPHPADEWYGSLHADLELLPRTGAEYRMIETYFEKTKSSGELLNVWKVERENEASRHEAKFEGLSNRRLLWHGTNIAVVAPILTNGLRIMPHSGGRVGSGIYMASMNRKSAEYTPSYGTPYSCMFLCEAALGKSHNITRDDYSLKKAPDGFDSVLAVGKTSPDTWETFQISGSEVEVPQSEGVRTGASSSFAHDEFLVYDEAQLRLRYVVSVKF